MIHPIYCVRDIKSVWLTPTVDVNDATAKRNFIYALSNSENIISASPADFALYKVASFDNETGIVIGIDPELIMRGDEYVR